MPRQSESGRGRPGAWLVGMVMVLAGVAAVGCFLAAAGRASLSGSVVLGLAAAVLLLGGFAVLRAESRARGGVLAADSTPAQRRIYRNMYRGPHRSAH